MLTPELRRYLESLRALPDMPVEQKIREALFGVGWNDESINDAIRYYNESKIKSSASVSPSGFLLDNTIPQKKNVEQKVSIPITEKEIDFMEGGDGISNDQEIREATLGKVSKPAPLQSTADAGHSSQSVLYPDNSSRLGMGGQDLNQSTIRSEETKLDTEIKQKDGPPLMDLDTLSNHISNKETVENVAEGVSVESKTFGQIASTNNIEQRKQIVMPEQSVRSQVNRDVLSQSKPPSIDGVRPFVRQQSQNPTRPVDSFPAKKITAPTIKMSDVRSPELAVSSEIKISEPQTQPATSSVIKKRSSRRFVTRVGFIAVLLGVIAATVYAYIMGLGPFASVGPYQESNFVANLVKGVASVKSAVVTSSYDLAFVERGEKTKQLPELASGATTTLAYFFPGLSFPVFKEPDANFGVSISGNFTKDDNQKDGFDYSLGVRALYSGAGKMINGEIGLLRIGTTTYFQVRKTPELTFLKTVFGDVSKIEGDWIDVSLSSGSASIIEGWVSRLGEVVDVVGKEVVLSTLANSLDQEKVVYFAKSPSSVDSWKGPATRYTLAFDFKRLAAAVRRMANDSLTSGIGTYASFSDDFAMFASALERSDAAPLLDYLSENALMTVDVSDDGTPIAIAFTSRLAPSSNAEAFANKELKATLAVTLTDVKPSSEVKVPTEVISLETATQKMMNLTSDEYNLSLQLQRVSSIAQAIDTFSKVVGRLPTSLDELLRVGSEFNIEDRVLEGSYKILGEQYASRPFLPLLPVDAYTGEPFFYGVGITGDDYNLAYSVSLPLIREESLKYMSPWSYQFLTAETTPKGNGYAWRIVKGENTLNKTMFSVEGKVYR